MRTFSPARFITSHPSLVVCSAERATELCNEPMTRANIAGLLSIADPPPYVAKRPHQNVLDALIHERAAVGLMDFRDLITETDGDGSAYVNIPTRAHAERVLSWFHSVATRPGARIVVHCTAGRSRSSAAAFIMLCDRLGPGKEAEAMAELLKACERTPLPNTLLVKFADELLGRKGEMIRVAQAQNDDPQDCEADGNKPVTGTALLAAIRRGEL